MKIQFQIRSVNVAAVTRNSLRESLERLQRLTPISAAAVVLEHRWDGAPAFRAFVSLAVPGSDIHAEARDHTLGVAWLKVRTALCKQIEERKAKRLAHDKSARLPLIFASSSSRGESATVTSLKTVKRFAILVVGSTVLAIGVALLVLPGPAFIVIPAGLAILAVEFAWARRWLQKARNLLPNGNDTPFFPAFVRRHARNFIGWASGRPHEHTKRKIEWKDKHEKQRHTQRTVSD